MMEERDRANRFKTALAVGDELYRRGELTPWTPEIMDRLIKEADEVEESH